MRFSIYALLTFLFVNNTLFAQTDDITPISPDRPGFGETSSNVVPGRIQVESSFWYDQAESSTFRTTNLNYINSVIRWGITKKVELRVYAGGLNTARFTDKFTNLSVTEFGLRPFSIGTKINMLNRKKPKGLEMAFVGMLQMPWIGNQNFRPQVMAPSFRLAFSNPFGDRITLHYNIGADWNGSQTASGMSWFYNAYLDMNIHQGLGGFIEAVGYINQNFDYINPGVDAGFYYVIGDAYQLDLSAGYFYDKDVPYWFGALGFSFRIN